jgi:hypothetical protein
LTFASGGYIIRMSPMAIGIFVVPELRESQKSAMPGNNDPAATPKNIVRNIQSVRYRSTNESCLLTVVIGSTPFFLV